MDPKIEHIIYIISLPLLLSILAGESANQFRENKAPQFLIFPKEAGEYGRSFMGFGHSLSGTIPR